MFSDALSVCLTKFLSCSGEVLEIFGYAHLSDWIAGESRLPCSSCTCSSERGGEVALDCSARPAAPRPGKTESGSGEDAEHTTKSARRVDMTERARDSSRRR